MNEEAPKLKKLLSSKKTEEEVNKKTEEEVNKKTEEEVKPETNDTEFESIFDISAYADLTEEEKTQIEAEARAQVAEELRAQRKKQFHKEVLRKYRTLGKPGQKIVPICLDLPGHANDVRLDGTVYFHGVTYRVTENVYKTLIDIQARAWEHENEIGGANRDLYKGRKPVLPVVTPSSITSQVNNRLAPVVRF